MDCPRSELMQRFFLTGFLLLLPACQMASAQNGQPVAAKPRVKLAVLLVFDQLRADYLTQHKALWLILTVMVYRLPAPTPCRCLAQNYTVLAPSFINDTSMDHVVNHVGGLLT